VTAAGDAPGLQRRVGYVAGSGPLQGIRVVELAAIGPGPFAGMMLADMGADVIRIDRPDRVGRERSLAGSHRVLDRGRRSIAIDLKNPGAAEVILRLIASADVLLEGFRPGVTERLGIGPAPALARNPALVYARMTGWGQSGSQARQAGHDINFIAQAGVLEPITNSPGEAPVAPLNLLGDFGGGGMLMAFGIVAAVLHAQRTGVGQVIDAAIVDGTALFTSMLHSMRADGDWDAPRGQNLLDGGAPFYRCYRTADGHWMAVGAIETQFFRILLDRLELADRVGVDAQYDVDQWARMETLFAQTFAGGTRDHWTAIFVGTDACVAPVVAPDEVVGHPQLAERGVYIHRDGMTQPAPAPRFSVTPGEVGRSAPMVGEHTWEVLAELSLDTAEIQNLLGAGVIARA